MEPDTEAARTETLGRFVAHLPYVVGHALADDDVVVSIRDTNGRSILNGRLTWEGDQTAQEIAAGITQVLDQTHHVGGAVVVGYGRDGKHWASLTADELAPALLVPLITVHVDDRTWRTQTPDGDWGPWHPVPDITADAAARGLPAPAQSREALAASVGPLTTPLFDPLPEAEAARYAQASPREHASAATDALDHITTGKVDDPAQMQALAHLVNTSVTTRDAVLAHAIDADADDDHVRDARITALIRTFRAAPAQQRPALATTTATAAHLAAWQPPKVHGLLEHAADNHLTTLVRKSLDKGTDPRPLRPRIAQAARDGLDAAQAAWNDVWRTRAGSSSRSTRLGQSAPTPPQKQVRDARDPSLKHGPHGVTNIPGM